MRIAVDVMGGDNRPSEIIEGAVRAAGEGIDVILVGSEEALSNDNQAEHIVATDIVTMHDKPTVRKDDSSMAVGIRAVSEKRADGFVSTGNTGALMAMSFLKYGAISGILRPAIATTIPTQNGFFVLLDSGANADSKPEHLFQFARMGSCYSRIVTGHARPKVGLFNIGAEKHKGTKVIQDAHKLFEETPAAGFEFIGNVEGSSVFFQDVDVVICEGFTGNSILKILEGFATLVMGNVKKEMASLDKEIAMKILYNLKKKFDYTEYGGAPFLGVNGITIKSHGSSNANAIYNAVKIANKLAEQNIVETIKQDVGKSEG